MKESDQTKKPENAEREPAAEVYNFNDEVLVKVTPAGEAIWDATEAHFQATAKKPEYYTPRKLQRDPDGYTRMQLWQVVQLFGTTMYNGQPHPAVEMEFKFVPKKPHQEFPDWVYEDPEELRRWEAEAAELDKDE